MQTYISILRGINVSGQKKIQMAGLRTLYEELNLKAVTTYIQSGNVIFKTGKKESDQNLSKKIEHAIREKYHFDVPVIIRTVEETEDIISINPFLKEGGIDIEKLHVTFLGDVPDKTKTESLKTLSYAPDRFIIAGKEVYLYCPGGYGITKLSNNFFEQKLKVKATTRNWKTVNQLFIMAAVKQKSFFPYAVTGYSCMTIIGTWL